MLFRLRFFGYLSLSVALVSCNTTGTPSPQVLLPAPWNLGDEFVLEGKIQNWPMGQLGELRAAAPVAADQTRTTSVNYNVHNIEADGRFRLGIAGAKSYDFSKVLRPFYNIQSLCDKQLLYQPQDAQVVDIAVFYVLVRNPINLPTDYLGSLKIFNSSLDSVYNAYIYTDRNVTVAGTCSYTSSDGKATYSNAYSLDFRVGWNKYNVVTGKTSDNQYTASLSNGHAGDLVWTFLPKKTP